MNKENTLQVLKFSVISCLIIFAALTRMLSPALAFLPNNFAPMNSIALFSGAKYRRPMSFLLPLIVIWSTDLLLNHWYFGKWMWFYQGFYWQYISYVLIVFLGYNTLQKTTIIRIFGIALSSSLLFFIVSNFGVWAQGMWYSHTLKGLLDCYIAGLLFLKGSILSDIFYSAFLFGCYELGCYNWNLYVINLRKN